MKKEQRKRAMRKRSGISRRKVPLRRSLCQSGSQWFLMRGRSPQAGPSSGREVPPPATSLPLRRTGPCRFVSGLVAKEGCLIRPPCSQSAACFERRSGTPMLAGVPGYAEPALHQASFKTAREAWPSEEQEEPESEVAGATPASAEAPGGYEGHAAPEEAPLEPAANVWEADAQERAPSDQPGTPSSSEPMTPPST